MSYHHSSPDVHDERDDIEEYGWDPGHEEHFDHGDYDDPDQIDNDGGEYSHDDGTDNWDPNEEYDEHGEHDELDCAVATADSESLGQDLQHNKDGDDDDTGHHPHFNQEGTQWKHPHPDAIQQLVMQALTEMGYS
ncbi:hypothetical protein PV04_03441 [Phialophora macrospora]|uniref:Uncharacterized protein n=1 Tax=Phialophora macrospora TaxID=1851006 RepID=A0A0D2D185_9EURO|nr:hypothetical protein PV04_03441 [Phialophora macrospora]